MNRQLHTLSSMLFVAVVLTMAGCGGAEPAPAGSVDLYTRRTLVRYDSAQAGPGQGSTLEAANLDLNDAVTVDESGQARLAFADFLVVDIFRDSDLRIEGLSAPDAPPAFRLRLEGGTVNGTMHAQELAGERVEPELRIDTKWAVIRNKGTLFMAHFDKASEETWVVVKQGAMSVEGAGKEVSVAAGQQTWVLPGQAPIDPIPACRDLVGDRFPLIDDLTNNVLPDLEWLCANSAATAPTPTSAPALATSTPSPRPTPTLRATSTPRPSTPTPLPTATPYASIFANPDAIQACTCTTLGWDAGNVASVSIDGAAVGLTGNRQECPADSRYYNLQAIAFAGDVIDASAGVQVLKPSVDFGADETNLYFDQCTRLRWTAYNVQSVSLDGQGVASSGNEVVCPSVTTTYNLHATTACGGEDRTVTINVSDPYYDLTPTATPYTATLSIQIGP